MGKRFKMERFSKFRKCVASKGLTGALFGCVARAEVGYENLLARCWRGGISHGGAGLKAGAMKKKLRKAAV
jgi:hypothetical protein